MRVFFLQNTLGKRVCGVGREGVRVGSSIRINKLERMNTQLKNKQNNNNNKHFFNARSTV